MSLWIAGCGETTESATPPDAGVDARVLSGAPSSPGSLGIEGGASWSPDGTLPVAEVGGSPGRAMTIGTFAGTWSAATDELRIWSTTERGALSSCLLNIQADGNPGTNPPSSIELYTETGTIFEDESCWYSGSPFGAGEFGTARAICGQIVVRNFYGRPFARVWAQVDAMQPTGVTGFGVSSEPVYADGALSGGFGRWDFSSLAASGQAGNASMVQWTFERPVGVTEFGFTGRVLSFEDELCNGLDDDCDGEVDTVGGVALTESCYSGPEGSAGIGACSAGVATCGGGTWGSCVGEVLPSTEVCDGQDNDCDGVIDEGVGTLYYRDLDNDTFGDPFTTTVACSVPVGYVAIAGDCADGFASVNPGATEICNGMDDDCDGLFDEGGVCLTQLGLACSSGSECTSGFCTNGACSPTGYRYIPGGTFTIGSPTDELGRFSNENQTSRTVSSFFLKTTEVTQGEWSASGYTNPSSFSTCGSTCPVERVNWWESLHYANHRSAAESLAACYVLTGCNANAVGGDRECSGVTLEGGASLPVSCEGYRLPTEAEWEHAYRAGTTTAFYNGPITQPTGNDPNLDGIGWYNQNSGSTTKPVGGKTPNAWGLHDMSGNVWEWTWDWYESSHASGAVTDYAGPASGSFRVRRGGSWNFIARYARAALRSYDSPGSQGDNLGLRLARTAP